MFLLWILLILKSSNIFSTSLTEGYFVIIAHILSSFKLLAFKILFSFVVRVFKLFLTLLEEIDNGFILLIFLLLLFCSIVPYLKLTVLVFFGTILNKEFVFDVFTMSDNILKVVFNNEAYLNEFINYISFIKYENPHYKTITIKKDVSNLKLKKKGMSNLVLPNLERNFDNKYNYSNNNNLSKSLSKPAKLKLNIKIDDVIKALKHNELNKDTYHGLSLNRDGEDEIITDYYQQQSFLRNSSPYITEHEKHVLEEKENKKHFFKNKEFFTSVGKYSMKQNFIPNYVGLTPGENPKNHEFREVDKNKWINKKGFNI